jgi:hypothetical protein
MRRLAVLPLLAFAAAACGGGDEASGPLPRAEYTRKANAICAEAERKLDALGGFDSYDELSKEMKVGEEALRTSVEDLRALKPPTNLTKGHNEFISLQEETADIAASISIAAGEDDNLEMQKQAERADKVTVAANEAARKIGLEGCVAG